MNMPNFTGEASLYQTNGQYQGNETTVTWSRQMIGTIHLAEIREAPPEVIVITDEASESPWFPPSWGGTIGSGGTSTSGPFEGNGGPGGGSDGGGEPFEKKPEHRKRPFKPQFKPNVGGKCNGYSMSGGVIIIERGNYTKLPGDIWFCAGPNKLSGSTESVQCQPEGTPPTGKSPCLDGWPV